MPNTRRWSEVKQRLEKEPGHHERLAAAQERLEREESTYLRHLADLRHARDMTQAELSRHLNVVQPSVSRLERQADMYVTTLRRYVEALGGRLEIRAVFDDLDYEIRFDDFETIDRSNPELNVSAGS